MQPKEYICQKINMVLGKFCYLPTGFNRINVCSCDTEVPDVIRWMFYTE